MKNNNEIVVTPLGTVSPYCKDDKNCPGFLIEINDKRILLDCGSGITRLLNMQKDLDNLTIIISHLHKDHYSDLSSIAYASYVYKNLGYLQDRIKVYIPKGDTIEVDEHYKDEDGWGAVRRITKPIADYEYLMNFGKENYLEIISYTSEEKINIDNIEITFTKNPHQIITNSIKINYKDIILVYSSDTGYQNNKLESFAKDADLFICESTYLKGQYKNSDNHLYAYEAALIAATANVKELLLTHFWPEIDRQKYIDEASEIFQNVTAAKENKKLILRRV